MPDGPGSIAATEPNDSFWRVMKSLIFGSSEDSLREKLEEAIDRHEGDPAPDVVGDLTPLERQMLRNLLHFGQRDAGEVGVPRADIVAVEESTTFAHLVQIFAEAGHSRLPVYREELDTIIGMVHMKDVFSILAARSEPPESIAALIREPLYVPMSRGALDLLADMRHKHVHLAIVLDEYSGTEGLVTIEDLIEQITGEIEDEHDEDAGSLLIPLDDGSWEADARVELRDVQAAIDPLLTQDENDVDTLGGLTAILAGCIPSVGDCVIHPSGWKIEVIEADDRRVHRVRLHSPANIKIAG